MNRSLLVFPLLAMSAAAAAQGIEPPPFAPPPRAYLPTAEEQAQLDAREKSLEERLSGLRAKNDNARWPDAAVYLHVARMADRLHLYTAKNQVGTVLRGLDQGLERCDLLSKGQTPWLTAPGRSLRGYVSRVDGSIQPYGVVLPAGFDANASANRLDVVLHGRGPTEVSFLSGFIPSATAKAPEQPFIEVHPFGRANNGWRWSGETDVFEALDQAKHLYKVDPNRTILRGFSMGGHGAWQIGVHYAGLWAAVTPGAGFTETRNYAKIPSPSPYVERGWHIYDAVDYALNLFDTPFIGYGGEDDPQLQASLNMKAAAEKEGLPFNLIVGPHTKHAYEPNSLKEIMRQLATHTRDPEPKQIKFTTWTLKYNQCKWVTVDALGEHYRRARVDAEAAGPTLTVKTENVTGLSLTPVPAGAKSLEIDGQHLSLASGTVHLTRSGGKWSTRAVGAGLHKRHNLQGPIDDAFMERFVVVRGTHTPWSPAVGSYAENTLKQFQQDWTYGFRGDVPLKDDTAASDKDWADGNLVLFGDPGSNSVLARIVDRLPLRWTRNGLDVGGKHYGPDHVPVLVYPNPLNPRHYVVINSGHTFGRKELDASNAFLFPKLPDWAVLQVGGTTPQVVAADYFDEGWKVK